MGRPSNVKILMTTGDVDPFEYGGGVVYQSGDHGDVTWEWWDEELEEGKGFTIYRVPVDADLVERYGAKFITGTAASMDMEPKALLEMARSPNIAQRVLVLETLEGYYGPYELDQYPLEMTRAELEDRWESAIDGYWNKQRRIVAGEFGSESGEALKLFDPVWLDRKGRVAFAKAVMQFRRAKINPQGLKARLAALDTLKALAEQAKEKRKRARGGAKPVKAAKAAPAKAPRKPKAAKASTAKPKPRKRPKPKPCPKCPPCPPCPEPVKSIKVVVAKPKAAKAAKPKAAKAAKPKAAKPKAAKAAKPKAAKPKAAKAAKPKAAKAAKPKAAKAARPPKPVKAKYRAGQHVTVPSLKATGMIESTRQVDAGDGHFRHAYNVVFDVPVSGMKNKWLLEKDIRAAKAPKAATKAPKAAKKPRKAAKKPKAAKAATKAPKATKKPRKAAKKPKAAKAAAKAPKAAKKPRRASKKPKAAKATSAPAAPPPAPKATKKPRKAAKKPKAAKAAAKAPKAAAPPPTPAPASKKGKSHDPAADIAAQWGIKV